MRYGIIKQCQREKFFKRSTIIEAENHVTLELPYTIKQIRTAKEHKLQKAMEKGIRKLRELGIQRAVLTDTLKTVLSPNIHMANFRVYDGSLMFFEFVPRMVKWLCERNGFEPPNVKISIREQKLSRISQTLIEKLCYQSKYMRVVTGDILAARRYASSMLEQLGFFLDICDIAALDEDFGDIVIDVDNFYVSASQSGEKIDGLVVEGIEVPHDTDMFDVLACLGLNSGGVHIDKWRMGDKYVDIMG
ncbi:MAG: hypothetical protein FWE04_00680 [Oscillospiraceae bacterium]|nr:hypothetical protein [Oscillospiraceae bacterium]